MVQFQMPKSTLPNSTLESIKQKALAGQQMMTPTPEKQGIYDNIVAQSKGYDKNQHQGGYGIGNLQNAGGGFNQFGNVDAMQGEIGRVNQVINNRNEYGLNNDVFTNYLDKLNIHNKPFQDQQNQITQSRDDYANSQQKADADRWTNASIDDIAKKYGFDYSRDYAKRQAESEAQALRNANADAQRRNESNKKVGTQNIDNNLMNMAEGLDRNYFQQMTAQQQNQVGTGMNAGIASDQDLRLQMNRQAEMGASYRDANLGKMKIDEEFNLNDLRLAEAMGLIDQQALAREDSLYNDRLVQGHGQLMDERTMANALDQQQWGRSQAEIDRAYDQQNVLRQAGQWQSQFDYGKERDQVADSQWQSTFDWGKLMDEAGLTGNYKGDRTLAGQQFDWGKLIDEANQTGMFGGKRNMAGQQFDWSKVVDQHGMGIADQQLALQRSAQAMRGSGGGGGGGKSSGSSKSKGSSGGSSGGTAKTSPKGSPGAAFNAAQKNIPQTPADKVWLQADKAMKDVTNQIIKATGKQPTKSQKKLWENAIYGGAKKKATHINNMGPLGKFM